MGDATTTMPFIPPPGEDFDAKSDENSGEAGDENSGDAGDE